MANTDPIPDAPAGAGVPDPAAPSPTSAAVVAAEVPPAVADAVVDDIIDAELDEDPDDAPEDVEELWDEFHAVVNMTSAELEEWLRTQAAGTDTEVEPDRAGDPTARTVLAVLGKRRTDLTGGDVDVMRRVVHVVRAERGTDAEATTRDDEWRRRLMALGHDPLKPPA